MVFTGKVEFYIDDDKESTEFLIIVAKDYREATDKLMHFYLDDGKDKEVEVLSFTLSLFSPDDFIIFGKEEEDTFNKAVATAAMNVFW